MNQCEFCGKPIVSPDDDWTPNGPECGYPGGKSCLAYYVSVSGIQEHLDQQVKEGKLVKTSGGYSMKNQEQDRCEHNQGCPHREGTLKFDETSGLTLFVANPPHTKTLPELAKEVLAVQDASNLSGVVYGFAEAMKHLCRLIPNTQDRNRHPICVMWSSKIASLTGWESNLTFTQSYEWVFEEAKK